MCLKSAVDKAEDAVAVCVLAAFDTAAAKDTFGCIANDSRCDIIIDSFCLLTLESILARAGQLSDIKQLALAVLITLLAIYRVVAQKQLNRCAASLGSLRR